MKNAKSSVSAIAQFVAAPIVAAPVAVKPVKTIAKNAVNKPVIKAAPVLATIKADYAIADYARPKAGRSLFAFTQAWLELSGMMNGARVSAKVLKQITGDTAVSYHTKNGNFAQDSGAIELTLKGNNFFTERMIGNQYDEKTLDTFKDILTTGKIDGVMVKAQSAIVKLAK